MSKHGRRFLRRGVMNPKHGNAAFYKGRGAANEGTHTSRGAYVVRPERLLRIVAPARELLAATQLRPYVHDAVPKPPRGARVAQLVGDGAAAPAAADQLR
jgi:hypothetical protein